MSNPFSHLYLNHLAADTAVAIVEHELARERNEVFVVERLPDYRTLPPQSVLGSASYSSRATRQTWLLEAKAYDVGWGYSSPFGLAQAYLHHKFPNRKIGHLKKAQYQEVVGRRRAAPLFAEPTVWMEGAYVDLKSAYWSILQVVGWEVDYWPGMWLMKKSSVSDFPWPQIKLARNSLVSIGLPTTLVVWNGEKIEMVKRPNPYINVMLWSLVQDVLHGVARDMINIAGAKYVHTDGYIVPLHKLAAAEQVLSDWGLPSSIKAQGEVRIAGVGAYAVGDKISRSRMITSKAFSNIDSPLTDWLRPRIAHFASLSSVD